MTRTRTFALGASLALLVSTAGLTPAVAQEAAASETPVAIPSDGYDISGTIALPADAEEPVPAVLMLHGYGSSGDEVGNMYARLAETLAAQGIGSLRIDFAGMGASEASILEYTPDSMLNDAIVALDWLEAQEMVDAERLGVQGFSLGSSVAARLLGVDDRPVAFGSWSGALYDGILTFQQGLLEQCEATGEGQIELDLGFRTITHPCEYFSQAEAATALTDLGSYDGALLLVAGTEDESVDPAVSENAATASASDDVTLELVEGGDHIFLVLTEDQTMAEQVIAMTADWYAEKL